MSYKRISRRQFISRSVSSTLAAEFGWASAPSKPIVSGKQDKAKGVTLEVHGDSRQGFYTVILFNERPVARHNGGGEFSVVFQNEDRSLERRIVNWRAKSWTGDGQQVSLLGECLLPNFSQSKETSAVQATTFIEVNYAVVTPRVVRKQIRLKQADLYMLYYQVSNRLEPLATPHKFWSFDQPDCQGGALHEYYPAAGFRTEDGLAVGLLTDSGFRNQWSRMIRIDGNPVKPAPIQIPDVSLYEVCGAAERAKGEFYIQQTFGGGLQQRESRGHEETIPLPPASLWRRVGKAALGQKDGATILQCQSSQDGVVIPLRLRGGEVYSVRLEYRSKRSFALDFWRVDEQFRMVENLSLYNDRVPASTEGWSVVQTTVFDFSWRGHGGALFISIPQSEQAIDLGVKSGVQEIVFRNLKVERLPARHEPYHQLPMGRAEQKTVFIFVDEHTPDTPRGYRLAAETHLAEALRFRGTTTEKVLYADAMMLSWVAGPKTFRPIIAPSIWYSAAGEMYLRDSFFAANGVHNRELNEGVFNLWGDNQGTNGAINTLVEPGMGNLERKSNDSTPLWLMWALRNRRRFGTKLPMDKVRKAAEYCLHTYDRNHDGICWAQFMMGQNDIVDFPNGTNEVGENQGVLAVTLRTIKELQISGVSEGIDENYIAKVEQGYRSYYDPERKIFRPMRHISDAVGFGAIFPEFLSLWLFNHKMLADEMVVNHLNTIPVMLFRKDAPYPEEGGTARPVMIGLTKDRKGWSYFTDQWHPMASNSFAANYANHTMDGIYYNGGSWMRIEVCGYVTGKLHGWSRAEKAIANRLWAEINIAREFPTSQEYLATNPAHPFFGYHRVFAWNVFVLSALELAGLRSPEMDPDYVQR